MKATSAAVAAAGLAGTAYAATADGWDNISYSSVEPVATTTDAPVYQTTVEPVATSTYEAPVYGTTDSAVVTSSDMPVYGGSSSTTESAVYTSTTTTGAADEWGSWSSTGSSAISTTTTTKSAVYTTASTTTKAPVYTTTTQAPVDTTTWAPVYGSSSGPVVYDSTTTLTSTITETVTVWPTDTATWSQWASTSTWSSEGWWGAMSTGAPGQCVVQVVTGYGEATWQPAPPTKPTSSAATSAPSAPAYTTTAAAAFYSASAAPSYSASSAPASKPSTGAYGITSNGNQWGMTYSPYTADSGCKDQGTINNDIATLAKKGFTSVRVYSTDCNTLEYVGQAAKDNNVKMILGVFISNTGVTGATPQIAEIVSWGQWDLVELIVVGNEALFNGFCNAGELAAFIGTAKAAFTAGGYTGPVTTTEDLATWTSVGSQFCGVVDVVAANLYAFFNPDTTADMAGDLITAQIAELAQVCGDKATYVMESGWPSAGSCNGKACPGKDEQATAIKSIQQSNGAKVIFFSYEDELWKTPGQYGVEQHWGCADVF